MPIDIAILATTVVTSFLVPWVKMASEEFAKKFAENTGKEAAEQASGLTKKVWERVKGVFSKPAEAATLESFKTTPDAVKAIVEAMLKEKLQSDPALAKDLDEMVQTKGPDGQTSMAQIMNAGVAGIVYMPNANFAGASHFNIVGAQAGQTPAAPKADEQK
ncbi:MAG: hypothetical protein L0Z70_03710 [Chloroflexi bacterium]|nr:hypothetical protein [Chloroflexota bacterium]